MPGLTGTNGSDTFFFQGEVTNLNLTLFNPYSGEFFGIDDEYNFNVVSYNGLNGSDTVFMTHMGDALFIADPFTNQQMVFNVEVFFAGDSGDVIHLAHETYTLGNVLIDGGGEEDLIFSNVGNDTINGREGDDILDGGPGNDVVNGGGNSVSIISGNDRISGGSGADLLRGEDGDDTFIFFVDGTFTADYLAYNIGSPGVPGTETYVHIAGSNLSMDVFNGGTGFDTLQMTAGNDTFFLDNPHHAFHPQGSSLRLIDVEQINAGDGNDVVDLTHDTLTYGDIIINGGAGNDHLWSSTGDDLINGGTGNDHIYGGFGEDELNGEDGDDEIYGSIGNDIMRGGAGNDVIYGGASSNSPYVVISEQAHHFTNSVIFPNLQETVSILDLVPPGDNALGIAAGDLSVDFATTATVSFLSTGAGYNNSLGFYNIALDGTIQSVKLAFPNVKDFGSGDSATIDLPGAPDTDFGFFIIPDGDRVNDFDDLDLENGTLRFIYKHNSAQERLATIHDQANKISLVYTNGAEEIVLQGVTNGPHGFYHTTLRDGATNLNHDGEVHVVSGLIQDGDTTKLRIGFEDLKHTGDADYNDVVFDITVQSKITVTTLVDDHDVLLGGAGNDIMDGGIGNDVLVGGEGMDTLYGEQGSDMFLFQSLADAGDMIMDFELGANGDIINITDVLEGYDHGLDNVNSFMRLVNSGGDTTLEVNADGMGADFVALATFDGGLGSATIASMLAAGNLEVQQSVVV